MTSLRSGIERNYIGQVSRDVVRLLKADVEPRRTHLGGRRVRRATRRVRLGPLRSRQRPTASRWSTSTTATASAADRAGDHRNRRVRTRPSRQRTARTGVVGRGDGRRRSVAAVEAEHTRPSAGVRARRDRAGRPSRRPAPVVRIGGQRSPSLVRSRCDLLAEGVRAARHDRLGSRRSTVLPYLVPTLVYGTREDKLPVHAAVHEGVGRVDLVGARRDRGGSTAGSTTAGCSRRCSVTNGRRRSMRPSPRFADRARASTACSTSSC